MAIFTKFGVPSYWITFNCNPKWPEIVEALKLGSCTNTEELSEYRPDLLLRVFHLKYCAFLSDIVEKQEFGKVVANASVLEF